MQTEIISLAESIRHNKVSSPSGLRGGGVDVSKTLCSFIVNFSKVSYEIKPTEDAHKFERKMSAELTEFSATKSLLPQD